MKAQLVPKACIGSSDQYIVDHEKGVIFSIFLNVYDYFKRNHPNWTIEKLADETAKACGVSSRSILETKMTKRNLYEIIKQHKDHYKEYKVDRMAKEAGFTVLRLPPYHCDLNPIEMGWSQIKRYVQSNKGFKIQEVQTLTNEAISKVTDVQWSNYCEKVKTVESDMWRLE